MFNFRQNQFLQAILLLGIAWLALKLFDILVVFFIAFLFTVILFPLVRRLRKQRMPAGLAALSAVAGTLGLLMAAGYFVVPPLVQQLAQFIDRLPYYIAQLQNTLPFTPEISFNSAEEFVRSHLQTLSGIVISITEATVTLLLAIVTIIVVVLYWLADYERIKETLLTYIPKDHRSRANDIWARIEKKLVNWMQGQLLLSLAVGILVWLGALIIGLPFPLVLGILAALLELVPTIGSIIAAIPGILLGLTVSVQTASAAAIMYTVVQQIESQLLAPYLLGKTVKLHPIVIVFSLLVGTVLYGIIGALIAVPVALVISAAVDSFRGEKPALLAWLGR